MLHETIRLQDVRRLLRSAQDLELSTDAIQRLRWFLYAREHDDNVSLTCRHFGISRSTFLRWADRFVATDLSTLEDGSRRPIKVRQSDIEPTTIDIIRSIRQAEPKLGKESIAVLLQTQHGITLSASTVGRIITRHKLFFGETKAHIEKRTFATDDIHTESDLSLNSVAPSPAQQAGTQSSEDFDDPYFLPTPGLTS